MSAKNKEVSYHTLAFICGLTKALRPKEHMTISQWADKNMVLPEGSNESGKFNTDSVPYQRAIMDAITDPYVTDVAVMSSAQAGKQPLFYVELVIIQTMSLRNNWL